MAKSVNPLIMGFYSLYEPRHLVPVSSSSISMQLTRLSKAQTHQSFLRKGSVCLQRKERDMKDDLEDQRKQALVKLKNVEIVKIITQLIFSVSLFSIVFAQSSWLDFHQLSHAIDKNYVFLLCNALLVFLAKYSGLIRSLSTSNRHDEILRACENISMVGCLTLEKEIPLTAREVLVQRNGSAPDVTMETVYPLLEKDEARRIKVLEMGMHGDEEKPEENVSSNEEEEEEEGNEGASAEELNKKFDEFIRRMKEEIRSEAQDQPQLVLISSN